jgi:hypothetical protein
MFGWASKPAFASSKAKSQPKGYNSTLFFVKADFVAVQISQQGENEVLGPAVEL